MTGGKVVYWTYRIVAQLPVGEFREIQVRGMRFSVIEDMPTSKIFAGGSADIPTRLFFVSADGVPLGKSVLF